MTAPLATSTQPSKLARLIVENVRNRSRLTTAYAESPLKLLTPATHTSACHVQLSNYGGGFVSGDAIQLDIQCMPNTRICIGTQANTRVYRTIGKAWSSQSIIGTVSAGALAVVCQDPLVLHANARFRQEQRWQVEDTGSLLVTEWLASGRHESGERFQFSKFESSIRIEKDSTPKIIDRYQLGGDHTPTLAGSPFGIFDHMLVVYAYGPKFTNHFVALESLATKKQRLNPKQPLVVWHKMDGGGILRCLARNRSELNETWTALSKLLACDSLLGFNPTSRKF